MATTPTVLRNAVDTPVSSLSPNNNWANVDRMGISNVSGNVAQDLIYFASTFPKGATVLKATLTVYTQNAYSAATTLTVQRLAAAWSVSRVTWNTKPGVTGATASLAKSTPIGANTRWDIDVTALMQTVANGAAWYGFLLTTNNTSQYNYVWSTQASNTAYRPTLTISWSEPPKTPTQLSPSGGRAVSLAKPTLQTDFIDVSGDTSLQAMQVQINTVNSFSGSLTFDSGTFQTSEPEMDLSQTAFGGLTADTTYYWRARLQDGSGLWSGWSAPATFVYTTRGTLTLNNPAADPNNFVAEATPPIDWTLTGRTQAAYQILIRKIISDTSIWKLPVWSSGKITSTNTVVTVPEGALRDNGAKYNLLLLVWDTISREATPGDPVAYSISRDFTYQYDATVDPVTSLVATPDPMYPWVKLTWDRATMPDKWNFYRNGKLISSSNGDRWFKSGTSYEAWDYNPLPRTQNSYQMIPVVNGKGASGNPTVTATPYTIGPTLSEAYGGNAVILLNGKPDMQLTEVSALYQPAGNGPPMLITQSERGYQGKVAGTLASIKNVSAATFKARFLAMTRKNGQQLYLTIADEAFRCIIYNASIVPRIKNEETIYDVSFDFAQTDYEP